MRHLLEHVITTAFCFEHKNEIWKALMNDNKTPTTIIRR